MKVLEIDKFSKRGIIGNIFKVRIKGEILRIMRTRLLNRSQTLSSKCDVVVADKTTVRKIRVLMSNRKQSLKVSGVWSTAKLLVQFVYLNMRLI